MGNFRGKGRWYAGVVSHVAPNGKYDIAYDDGDKEAGVRRDFIMAQWK